MNFKGWLLVHLILLCHTCQVYVHAQSRTRVSLETNLVNPFMKGYSMFIYVKPSFTNKLRFGIGTYTIQTPTIITNIKSTYEQLSVELKKGNMRICNSFNFQVEYFPKGVDKNWFVGQQVSFLNYRFCSPSDLWSGKLNTTSFLTYSGYIYRIANSRFYIKPWSGIGFLKLTTNKGSRLGACEFSKVSYLMLGINFSVHL